MKFYDRENEQQVLGFFCKKAELLKVTIHIGSFSLEDM